MPMTQSEHRCERIPANGISVLGADYFLPGSGWEWCLVVERQATDQDLEANPILEEIGETIWSTAVGITHCPFCGQQLTEAMERGQDLPPEFVHVDSSGWNFKIQ